MAMLASLYDLTVRQVAMLHEHEPPAGVGDEFTERRQDELSHEQDVLLAEAAGLSTPCALAIGQKLGLWLERYGENAMEPERALIESVASDAVALAAYRVTEVPSERARLA